MSKFSMALRDTLFPQSYGRELVKAELVPGLASGLGAPNAAVLKAFGDAARAQNLNPLDPTPNNGDEEPTMLSGYECRNIARLPHIVGFVQNRVNQWRQAGQRRYDQSSFGYEIVHVDPKKTLDRRQKRDAEMAYEALEAGQPMPEKMALLGRDSMEMDRGVGEAIPDSSRRRLPMAWTPWDGATMRWAEPTAQEVNVGRYNPLTRPVCQWQDGVLKRVIDRRFAIVAIRNPTTDTWRRGYGYPEVEMAAADVVRVLKADTWNSNVFDSGYGIPSFLLHRMKMSPEEWKAYTEEFQHQFRGMKNAHKVGLLLASPKMQSLGMEGEDIEKIDFASSMKDMEFRLLLGYYYRRLAMAFQTDLEELGMTDPADTGKSTLSEADSSWKIAMSREKGLRTGLEAVGSELTRVMVAPFNPELRLVFGGLNNMSPEKRAAYNKARGFWMTQNELRKEDDKPPLADPVYDEHPAEVTNRIQVQSKQMIDLQAIQQEQDRKAQAAGQPDPNADVPPPGEDFPPPQPGVDDA